MKNLPIKILLAVVLLSVLFATSNVSATKAEM